MYALIYDEYDLNKPQKAVIFVHKTRETAEKALLKRQKKLGRRVWECNTRIVWVDRKVRTGDHVSVPEYSTWRPGEKIPEGEMYPSAD